MPTAHSKESTGEHQKKRHLAAVIPLERPATKKLNKSDHETLKLRTAPDDNQSPTCEIALEFFSTGSPEAWLNFLESINKVWEGQHLTTAASRYSLFRCSLEGDALAAFNAAADQCEGETLANLPAVVNDVTTHVFPERAARMQKRWMRRQLRKPLELSVREHVARVVEINQALEQFPMADDMEPVQKLDDDELMDILEFGTPNSWQKQMILHDFDPINGNTADFIQFCERMEKTEDKPAPKKENANGKKRAHNKHGNKKEERPKKGNSSHCCMLHGPNDVHNTNECRTLKFQAERMKQTCKAQHPTEKKNYKQRQEMHMLVAEAVAEALKTKKKSTRTNKKRKKSSSVEDENWSYDKVVQKERQDSDSSSDEMSASETSATSSGSGSSSSSSE